MEIDLTMDALFLFLTQTVTAGATVIAIIVLAMAFLIGLKMLSGGKRRRHSEEDHTRLVQEMYRTLDGMERRMEALETLLMERDGKTSQDTNAAASAAEDDREPL